jgi:hypothetical protein
LRENILMEYGEFKDVGFVRGENLFIFIMLRGISKSSKSISICEISSCFYEEELYESSEWVRERGEI